MRTTERRWMTLLGIGLTLLVLASCGRVPTTGPGIVDFVGTWRGEALTYDLCALDCGTVSGPETVVIKITQDDGKLIVDYDGVCTYMVEAVGSAFIGEEVDRGGGDYRCADPGTDPLPIAAELDDGVLSGRAYFETAGATYCMLEIGCYAEFEVTRDD